MRLTATNLVIAELQRLILHWAGVTTALQALDRIESSTRVSIICAIETHHASAEAWLAQSFEYQMTYTDAVSFAVMKGSHCAGFMSLDAGVSRRQRLSMGSSLILGPGAGKAGESSKDESNWDVIMRG